MINKLFVDTNLILGYLLKQDVFHEKAVDIINHFLDIGLYISNHVIDEVITIIGQKLTPNEAILTYDWLNDNFIIVNENEIADYNDKVMSVYKQYNKGKQKLGFTDCSIIVTMESYDIKDLITFDNELSKVNGINIFR